MRSSGAKKNAAVASEGHRNSNDKVTYCYSRGRHHNRSGCVLKKKKRSPISWPGQYAAKSREAALNQHLETLPSDCCAPLLQLTLLFGWCSDLPDQQICIVKKYKLIAHAYTSATLMFQLLLFFGWLGVLFVFVFCLQKSQTNTSQESHASY